MTLRRQCRISRQSLTGRGALEHNISSKIFAFVAGDFQTDELQQLDLRSVFSGGLGYHLIKSERTTLNLLGGGNYTREKYADFSRNVAGLTLGEELSTKLGGILRLRKIVLLSRFERNRRISR